MGAKKPVTITLDSKNDAETLRWVLHHHMTGRGQKVSDWMSHDSSIWRMYEQVRTALGDGGRDE